MTVGCTMAMVGFFMYSHTKLALLKLPTDPRASSSEAGNGSGAESGAEEDVPLKSMVNGAGVGTMTASSRTASSSKM
jgi:hypothetical protein